MGLFDKKYCDICKNKIGLLGNRKLENGNLCKECAAKLSPWFSDRRRSTVEEIHQQLDYREENKAAVEAFHTTRSLGSGTKLLLDEDAGKFMVTSARNLREANPDVLDFSQVTGCRVDVDEDKTELKREDKDGKEVSYNPPRYTYDYDFYVIINVNAPYFDEIRFRLNSSSIESPVQITRGSAVRPLPPLVKPGVRPGGVPPRPGMAPRPGMGGIPVEYSECEKLGEEIVAALTQVRAEVRQAAEEARAPRAAVTCPWCGATTTPDAEGRCEFCGGAVNA